MANEETRQAVIKYVKDYHGRKGEAPSLRNITKHFKLNFTRFYKVFPKGVAEACRLAGVPAPEERIKRMRKAVAASKTRVGANEVVEASPFKLTLNEELSKLLLGVSHLEGEKDPSLIIAELLDFDVEIRKHGLTLNDVKSVKGFLDIAAGAGWADFKSIVYTMIALWRRGVISLKPATMKELLALLQKISEKGYTVERFVEYVKAHEFEIGMYRAYREGRISGEQFYELMLEE